MRQMSASVQVPLGDYAAQGTSKVAQWDSKGTITGLMAKVGRSQ